MKKKLWRKLTTFSKTLMKMKISGVIFIGRKTNNFSSQ